MKSILFTAALGFSFTLTQAQLNKGTVDPGTHLNCKHNEMLVKHCQSLGIDYETAPETIAYEQEIQELIRNQESHAGERSVIYVIPVVFHIVHIGGVENISDAQVHDAVAILNRDFNKLNADTSLVVPSFSGNIANVGFEFRLAQKDALGNCVSGITRTFSSTTLDGDDNMVDQVNLNLNGGTSTNNIRFPRNKYLNIWVCKNAAGAAGYTNTPSSFIPAKLDGIWIGYNYCGSIEAGSETTSRALTHEVGHWFNLKHVWGNTNNPGVSCGDDSVSDTPQTKGWTTCNTSGSVCNPPVIENVQNYMEYAYCSRMFTNGQKSRMIAAITSSTAGRNNLWTTTNLNAAGVNGPDNLCDADFAADETVICAGDSVQFTDGSFHGPTSWNWSFPSGSPASSTVQNPVVTYNTVGQYNVSLTSTNSSGSMSESKTNYITVIDPVGAAVPIMEGFESVSSIPNSDWFITNSDGMQTWQVVTGVGASGTKCIKLDNFAFNNVGGKDNILSKTYDLTGVGNVEIRFKYAYKKRAAANNEKLKIFISNNCGQSWVLRKQISGSTLGSAISTTAYNSPSASDWTDVVVDNIVSSYYTQGFRFRIEFESDGGNNIFIDNINLDVNVGTPEITAENLSFSIYPNPVNANATIDFTLASAEKVQVKVTDVVGRVVMVLENGVRTAGNHQLQFNAAKLGAKGVYFVTLHAGTIVQTKKIVVE